MDKAAMPEGKYLASVKLGPKGQIVVPKDCLLYTSRCV